jgi:hypothetical protein
MFYLDTHVLSEHPCFLGGTSMIIYLDMLPVTSVTA